MHPRWGRFTVKGTEEVERLVASQMERVRSACGEAFEGMPVECVLLVGGYGRGEGGVVCENGVQKPHNNFDFVVITGGSTRDAAPVESKARLLFDSLAAELGIGIDYSVIPRRKLEWSPCLVMWYDMRHGHKVILGPDDYMERFTRFTLDAVLPSDVLALLVNRGTLFVINRVLLRQHGPKPGESAARTFIKHMAKAVIGYGDALLFFLGDYHWSYVEKARRMKRRTDVPEAFRKAYADAMDFRFQPDYEAHMQREFDRWLQDAMALCQNVHLECERRRLGLADLQWRDYMRPFFEGMLRDRMGSARAWARKTLNLLRTPPCPLGELPVLARLGFRSGGVRGILTAVFPLVAYRVERETAARLLQTAGAVDGAGWGELDEAYLRLWAEAGDTNFLRGLRTMGIDIGLAGAGKEAA